MTALLYLDSSAIVKLAVEEPESAALRRHLGRRRQMVSSALARAEVLRALAHAGSDAVAAGRRALTTVDLVRVSDRVLNAAGALAPHTLRTLHAIHLATAQQLAPELRQLVTYDQRMADGAMQLGIAVAAPV